MPPDLRGWGVRLLALIGWRRGGQLRAIDREARRPAVPIVICGRDPGGWRVLLMRGGRTVADMDAGAARRLAEQLNKAADLIEGKCW